MHISLTPELENIVRMKVASGLYNNASEVVREALRKVYADDELRKLKLERLREEIKLGLEQADRGEFATSSMDEIWSEIKNNNLKPEQGKAQ